MKYINIFNKFKNTLIYKLLLILSIIGTFAFIVSAYLVFKNHENILIDIEKYNTNNLEKIIKSIKEHVIKEHTERMEKDIHMIAESSSYYLQNFDKEGLKKILRYSIKKEKCIMLIQVLNNDLNDLNDVFLMSFVKNDKVVFGKNTPKGLEKLEKIRAPINDMTKSNKQIGEIIMYYDNSHARNDILSLEEKSKKDMRLFNEYTYNNLYDATKKNLVIGFLALVFALVFMMILVKKTVNDPLVKLKLGLDDFFLFIQNKKNIISKIDIYSKDEFGAMAHSLNESIAVSSKFLKDNYELKIALSLQTKKEKALLDNASQGFLTFNESLIIDTGYSIKCEEFLGSDIANKNILNILFLEDNEKIHKSKNVLLSTLGMQNKVLQTSMLTLLPTNIVLNKLYLKLEYKIVEDEKFLLIITDKTKKN